MWALTQTNGAENADRDVVAELVNTDPTIG